MGGGKGQTSTSSVSIPPQVLAEYQSVNNKANATANTPFTPYSSNPNAFVAPLTGTQQAGIANTNAAVGTAQPYYDQATGQLISAQNSAVPFYGQAQGDIQGAQTIGDLLGSSSYGAIAGAQAGAQPYNAAAGSNYQNAYNSSQPYNMGATGLAIAGAGQANPSDLNSQAIQKYLSPYLGTVLQGTAGILNQNNQQQQAGQLGNAINQGAFGGDRAGIAAANLEQQQNLANSQIYSGILNQGYNTALSTAEGQQQLGLGAAQANRAALQNAEQQIQGLGQQQYQQGMGLGSAQQGLGQQTYAQGANTAAQLAALGQQQFGQGITAAGQEAGLGAGLYGMGSNTSQGLANLGTASQTAALQGAQAQMGVGQVEQQTQQAGDTALYNQFLQQQSYPFQVDQFLANIAEGTGALSGSTTTTTQPGGFFSDERLKENIRAVGKTFDGQKIYAYNYKGDKRTQVGLIAQEVEKKHPEAVGGHMGFKTVDYGVATDKAAERGKFASGGLTSHGETPQNLQEAMAAILNSDHAMYASGGRAAKTYGGGLALPGVDPNYISALLQAQNQSYAPFGNSGLYGGQAGGAPRGGSSYVPAANLPVSQLQVAHPPTEAPQSGLSQIKQITDLANTVHKGVDSLHKKSTNDNSTDNSLADAGGDSSLYRKHGGRLHRADGGVNDDSPEGIYDDPTGLKMKIPNDHPTAKLQTAQPPQQSGGSGLGDILGIAKDVIPFLATGGRAGFADGGSPDDPLTPDTGGNPRTLAFLKQILSKDYSDLPPMPSSSVGAAGLGAAAPPPVAKPNPIVPASGSDKDVDAAVRMIYGEAGGEPDLGKIAALQVFLNRAKNSGKPLSAEIMAPHQSEAMTNGVKLDPQSATYQRILHNIVLPALSGDAPNPIGNDTHFLNPDLQTRIDKRPMPKWAQGDGQRIGNHVFYMKSGGRAGFADGGSPDDPSPIDMIADDTPQDPVKKALSIVQLPKAQTDQEPAKAASEPDQEAYSAAAPSDPTNLLPAGLGAAQPPHHGFLSGLGDRLAHPNGKPDLIVPILEGLAAMGTAPTRHLGVALAAGVGAGAQGYQKQREYQQEQVRIAQNQSLVNADVFQKMLGINRFERRGNGQWFDKTNPQDGLISDGEYQRRLASMVNGASGPNAQGIVGGTQSPSSGTPTSLGVTDPTQPVSATPVQGGASPTAPSSPPQQGAATPMSPLEKVYANADKEPRVAALRSQIDGLTQQADDLTNKANDPALIGRPEAQGYLSQAQALRSQAELLLPQWSSMREQFAAPDVANISHAKQASFDVQNSAKTAAFNEAQQAQQALTNANAAMNVMFDPKTGTPLINGGPLAARVGHVGQLMEQFGFSPEFVNELLHTNPNHQAELNKLQTTMGTEMARQELAGSPIRVGEFKQFMSTVPSSDIPAEAAKWIIQNSIIPQAKLKLGTWDAVKGIDPTGGDVRGTALDYQRQHPWFQTQGASSKPVKINSPQDIARLAHGTPFIIPSGPNKGKIGYAQ